MRKIILIAAASLALAACGADHVASPSDDYLVCQGEPDVPAGDATTGAISDVDNANYLKGLRGAGQDCRSKLQYVHDWFAVAKKKLKH